MLLSPRPFGSR